VGLADTVLAHSWHFVDINRFATELRTIAVLNLKLCQFPYVISSDPNDDWRSNLTQAGCYNAHDDNYDRIQTGLVRTIVGTAYSGQIPDFSSP